MNSVETKSMTEKVVNWINRKVVGEIVEFVALEKLTGLQKSDPKFVTILNTARRQLSKHHMLQLINERSIGYRVACSRPYGADVAVWLNLPIITYDSIRVDCSESKEEVQNWILGAIADKLLLKKGD